MQRAVDVLRGGPLALPVLAVRLRLDSPESLEIAASEISKWIRTRHGVGVAPFTNARFRAAGDIPDLTSRLDEDPNLGRGWVVQLSHPGDEDPTWLWRVDVWVVEDLVGADTAVTTRVSVESLRPDRISAPNVAAGRPAFVGEIIRSLDLRADGIRLRQVHPVSRGLQAEEFVAFLDREDRILPVIAVSERRGFEDEADVRADELLGRLGGVSHVVRLDASGSWELSSHLPEGGGCFAGAVRIYWPGQVSTDPTHRHPLFVSRRIEQVGWEGTRREIVERIGTQSAAAIGLPRLVLGIRNAVRARARQTDEFRRLERAKLLAGYRAREAQVRALEAKLADAGTMGTAADGSLTNEVLAELEAQLQKNEALEREFEDARVELELAHEENEALQARVSTAEQNLRDVYLTPMINSANTPQLEEMEMPELLAALQLEHGALWLTDNAIESWRRHPSASPKKVRDALLRFRDAAQAWRDAGTSVGNQLNVWLATEYGLELAMADEPLRRLRKDLFIFEGQSWSQELHLKLGDNTSPENVARVYFAVDNNDQRWIVNHVGLKLYGL